MPAVVYPPWAEQMRAIFRGETISQFILSGNIRDLVPHVEGSQSRYLSIRDYLGGVLFEPFDVVLFFDRGRGVTLVKGWEHFYQFLQMFDRFHGTRLAGDAGVRGDAAKALDHPGLLPKAPGQALELIDRFLYGIQKLSRQGAGAGPRSAAVVIDYAAFIAPRGESLYLSGESGSNLIKILNWGADPALTSAKIVTLLLAENLSDLNSLLVESPYNAKIRLPLPMRAEIESFLAFLAAQEAGLAGSSEVPLPVLAEKLVGLSRVNVKGLVLQALRNQKPLTLAYLTGVKKELIEKEANGRLEFIESDRSLEDVSGHTEAKRWLREDALLLKRGVSPALPMGYLIAGRIGTGKTFLVECFAGECGVPFVEMKNFREKWVGATEGNLEKIFEILHALGQVVVFVDEADQFTGQRQGGEGGDSGLSGRVYGMLAKEMSDTRNRGKILWLFATSRPDLVEVDLKRQGRLDVHIPLFPPESPEEKRSLFMAMARKLKLKLAPEDLPELPFSDPVSGNELEGILVRAYREFMLQPEDAPARELRQILDEVAAGFRPSAHTERLELMDLLAVKECTDERFLPARYRTLARGEMEERIALLRSRVDRH